MSQFFPGPSPLQVDQDAIDKEIKEEVAALNSKIAKQEINSNITVTSTTLTGYSFGNTLQITSDGLYSIKTAQTSSSPANLILNLMNSNSVDIYRHNYINAPENATIQTPLFYMKAGTYNLRATGGTTVLLKYT